MIIRYNPELSIEEIEDIKDRIKENDGYCLCAILKEEDTRCMCKAFRDKSTGVCDCGLYEKL